MDGSDRRRHVLVVDDDPAFRLLVAHALGRDFRVEILGDPLEAVARVRFARPDCVLSDIVMPGIDGTELVRRLKADPELRFIPVILVTGADPRERVVTALDAGADDYLGKPVVVEELRARVRSAIRHYDVHRDLLAGRERASRAHPYETLGRIAAGHAPNMLAELRRGADGLRVALGACAELAARRGRASGVGPRPTEATDPSQVAAEAGEVGEDGLAALGRVAAVFEGLRGEGDRRLDRLIGAISAAVFAALAPQAEVTIEVAKVHVPDGVDVTALRQILINLFANAAQSMRQCCGQRRQRIVVRGSASEDGNWTIQVTDNGPGMAPDLMARCFEPFVVGDGFGDGPGLGLPLARDLAWRFCHATLTCEPGPGGEGLSVVLKGQPLTKGGAAANCIAPESTSSAT